MFTKFCFMQAMTNGLRKIYLKCMSAYQSRDRAALEHFVRRFLSLTSDIDLILRSEPQFLLGQWTGNAAKMAFQRKSDQDWIQLNARNQGFLDNKIGHFLWCFFSVTLWGPEGNILDYAAKQWSGLVSGYYYPRWKLFFKTLKK